MDIVSTRSGGYLPLALDLLQHPDYQLSTRDYTSSAPETSVLPVDSLPHPFSFVTEIPGRVRVTKTYVFTPDSYATDIEIKVENLGSESLVDQLGLSFFFQPYEEKESSYNPSHLSVHSKDGTDNYPLKDLIKKEKDLVFRASTEWAAYENNYFIQAVMPVDAGAFQLFPRVVDPEKGLVRLVYLSEPFSVGAGETKLFKTRIYSGPKELGSLERAGHNLTTAVDYGWFTVIAKPLFLLLEWIHRYVGNYGWAIILITILIKIVFWPLTHKSYKSMQKMKKIQPKIAQIKEKYKDDKEKLNVELMAVYKTYNVNPMGGCLPMVLQIPVFFALYRMLNGAVELRHEPFIWWIHDLTAPDRLDIGFQIPYLGGLPVLTLLMGLSMFLQQKMTPTGGDPRQEQIMLLMPVVFTFMFINFPAGLVLYWLVNNVLSIAQQYFINRRA